MFSSDRDARFANLIELLRARAAEHGLARRFPLSCRRRDRRVAPHLRRAGIAGPRHCGGPRAAGRGGRPRPAFLFGRPRIHRRFLGLPVRRRCGRPGFSRAPSSADSAPAGHCRGFRSQVRADDGEDPPPGGRFVQARAGAEEIAVAGDRRFARGARGANGAIPAQLSKRWRSCNTLRARRPRRAASW